MLHLSGIKPKTEHAGKVQQSQLISTFGIGMVVDFVRDTVMIAGVDDWDGSNEEQWLFNNSLQAIIGIKHFIAPKTATKKGHIKSDDVESYIFPQKLYCPTCNHIIDAHELGNQKKKHNCFIQSELKHGKPCNSHLVASRFVILCPNGHIDDFPYSWWVHHGNECCKCKNPRIRMYNYDNRSDIDSLVIECKDCKATRKMVSAFSKNALAGYGCKGKHPHLGKNYTSNCAETMTVRLRTSSSVYFPATMSALTIPPWSRKVIQLVESKYDKLEKCSSEEVKRYILCEIKEKHPSIQLSDDQLLAAYKQIKEWKNSPKILSMADILAIEYDVLCKGASNDDEYVSTATEVPMGFESLFDAVTVIEKLTVINTLVGFTRINPWDGDLKSKQLAPLSKTKKDWLPAAKLLGEGIFFKFNQNALDRWKDIVANRYDNMESGLAESFLENDRFSPQYVALHTFAHLLIRQLADDCGYSASSIKEKIYSTYTDKPDRPKMCGVLIYLTTSDSEGSLGGLISIANDPERMRSVLKNMLHKAQWCSADPLCCNSTQQGFNSLNYAACHDCVLLPETSCEFMNVLLDRVSIVGRPGEPNLGLMGSMIK